MEQECRPRVGGQRRIPEKVTFQLRPEPERGKRDQVRGNGWASREITAQWRTTRNVSTSNTEREEDKSWKHGGGVGRSLSKQDILSHVKTLGCMLKPRGATEQFSAGESHDQTCTLKATSAGLWEMVGRNTGFQ